ncbi:MAG: lytic murein transglycosylase [Alphaproteobacteria bacterium]|nr:lytic murein transglycosylase [Alphaproteobacteria bacterium]
MVIVRHQRARIVIAASIIAALSGCAAGSAGKANPPTPAPKPATAEVPAPAAPASQSFEAWVRSFRTEALAAGIRPDIFDKAFKGIAPNPDVMALNENQPEFVKPIWDYLDSAVSAKRVGDGEENFAANRAALMTAAKRSGVPPEIIVAIWGLESSYGRIMGDFNVIEALATLAYSGPRTDYGRAQLLAALKILNEGDIAPSRMLGSWAGAVGHTQFAPTSYLTFAVDGDGDGLRNLWDSLPDVFASTGHYLAQNGWAPNEPWGFEVTLPKGFDYAAADALITKPVSEWVELGVRRMGGGKLTVRGVHLGMEAAIIVPGGHKGPAFIVFRNFNAILRYNNATSYALAVGLLSDAIAGRSTVIAPWPRGERPLTLAERTELQQLLAQRGFEVGEVDGVLGKQTRAAIRAYQQTAGLVPDGFATASLLARLRKTGS